MLTQDMQELKRGFNTLDFIAHTVKNLWDEQVCQAAQMCRIEGRLSVLESDVATLKNDVIEIKKALQIITDHLGVKPKKR